MAEAIDILKQQGAIIVDPADIPSIVTAGSGPEFPRLGYVLRRDRVKGKDADCSVVLKYGMKRDFNKWLARSARRAGENAHRIARMEHHAPQGRRHSLWPVALDISDEMDVEADRARYESDRAKESRFPRPMASTRR